MIQQFKSIFEFAMSAQTRTKLTEILHLPSELETSSDIKIIIKDAEGLDHFHENFSSMETEEIIENFVDGSRSFEERQTYWNELCKRDRDLGREAITNLCRSYEFSGSKDFLTFICFLFESNILDLFEKIECVRTIQNAKHPSSRTYWMAILHEFREQSKESRPSIALYIDVLRFLMDGKFEDQIIDSIKWLCNESSAAFLYRTIVSIHRESEAPVNIDQDPPRRISTEYLHCLYQTFFHSVTDDQYRILSAQYLLNNKIDNNAAEQCLLSIATNSSRSHQIRADAADTLIKVGSEGVRTQSLDVLKELGKDLTQAPSIGTNKENVHLFDNSVTEFLLQLGALKLATIYRNGSDHTRSFEDVVQIIKLMPQYQTSQDLINSSLLRIRIDQILYPGSQTLSTIFLRIFQTIEHHENKDLLMERLFQELEEMSGLCSSGNVTRLVNVFSGIDGFLLRVGWKEQITSNVAGRITALAKIAQDLETRDKFAERGILLSKEQLEKIDQEFRSLVLTEMLNTQIEDRVNWNRFLRQIISSLTNEMRAEFVESGHLSSEDFELYFREAIVFYETGVRE